MNEKFEYINVTEIPGGRATKEQLSMAVTRYNLVASLSEEKTVLEVACGSGYGLAMLLKKAKTVIGGDIDQKLVNIAKNQYKERASIITLNAEELPFKDNSFDVVCILEAIYYVEDVKVFMSEVKRVLKKNGKIIVCFPNVEWKRFNPSPFSSKYFTFREFEEILTNFEFEVITLFGFRYHINGIKSHFLDLLRSVAVRFSLIPKSFEWKDKIKRIIFGKLESIPLELSVEDGNIYPLKDFEEIKEDYVNYRVVYSIGTKK